jgi:hypothetical protein
LSSNISRQTQLTLNKINDKLDDVFEQETDIEKDLKNNIDFKIPSLNLKIENNEAQNNIDKSKE